MCGNLIILLFKRLFSLFIFSPIRNVLLLQNYENNCERSLDKRSVSMYNNEVNNDMMLLVYKEYSNIAASIRHVR